MRITRDLLNRAKTVFKYVEYLEFLNENKGDDPELNIEYWQLKTDLDNIIERKFYEKLGLQLGLALWPTLTSRTLAYYLPIFESRLITTLKEIYDELGIYKEPSIDDLTFINLFKCGGGYCISRD